MSAPRRVKMRNGTKTDLAWGAGGRGNRDSRKRIKMRTYQRHFLKKTTRSKVKNYFGKDMFQVILKKEVGHGLKLKINCPLIKKASVD